MKIKRINFPIIFYESEHGDLKKYTAHCLTLDIIFDADTINEALSGLLELIQCSVDSAKKHKANIFHNAPNEYWSMFNKAKNLNNKEMYK